MPKGKKKKKFIDKKNSVTFHLVHRSQKDPLVADETAPQRVFVPAADKQAAKIARKTLDKENRIEEQEKYGIYFDDDYNYLQHLRDVSALSTEWERVDNANQSKRDDKDIPKINLPSSVFASNVEEKVGMLNKAAPISGPRLDLDTDVIAAMDDDFDYDDPENQLEDNFIELANAENSDEDIDEHDSIIEFEHLLNKLNNESDKSDVSCDGHMQFSDEERDEIASLEGRQYSYKDEETKSRFTEYSMSSSVIKRNEQLTLLDDKFEKAYAIYDENEIGALDCDEIEGHVALDSDLVQQCAIEFEKKQREAAENIAELMKDRMKIIEKEYSSEDDNDLEKLVVDTREKDTWDCESILSTYSNIYNHPKLITEPKSVQKIKIDPRTGIPKNVLGNKSGKLTAAALSQFNRNNDAEVEQLKDLQSLAESRKSMLSVLSIRPKGETSNEKNTRKKLLKEYRRERRIERKANTEAFKEETKRQKQIMLNNKQNVQGNRIL